MAATGGVVGFTVGYFFLEETRGRNILHSVSEKPYDAAVYTAEGNDNDQDFYPNDYQQLQEQEESNGGHDPSTASLKTSTNRDSEAVDMMGDDLERLPLMLPPNATQAQASQQQVKFENRRKSMGTVSNQYGSMSTLAHEAGTVSPTGSPYRQPSQNNNYTSASARSTLSRRPGGPPIRPSLFHQPTSGSGSTSGFAGSVFASSYSERPLSSAGGGVRRASSFYTYTRPLSSGGLFSMADPSSLGRRGVGMEGGVEIPADATLLTFNGYTNDPYFDGRGGIGGLTTTTTAMDSGRRMSVAPSQVFLLPPDPNNKDPHQPMQLLVVQSPPQEVGLSPLSITTIVAYSMLALHSIVFEEVYTLYAVTPLASHGLGWNAMQLSTSLASMGLVQLGLQFIVYPRLERRFSAVWLFRGAQLLYGCIYLTFPMIRKFAVDETDTEKGGQIGRVRTLVLIGLVFKYCCSVFSYTSVMVMVKSFVVFIFFAFTPLPDLIFYMSK